MHKATRPFDSYCFPCFDVGCNLLVCVNDSTEDFAPSLPYVTPSVFHHSCHSRKRSHAWKFFFFGGGGISEAEKVHTDLSTLGLYSALCLVS